MALRLSDCDFEYLRPPKEVFDVEHSEHYIRHGEGKKSIRKIFANVKYYDDELKKLQEFKALIQKENVQLPPDWTEVDTIRFMYAGKLEVKKSLKIMKQHLQWRALPDRETITPAALKYLHDGTVYISGRDKQFRPIIIVNIYKVDSKTMILKDYIEALCFVLDVVRRIYFVPGKVENWVIFVEANNQGIFDFPVKALTTFNDVTSVNYTSTLDKLYILNPPSVLKKTWTFFSSFIDSETKSKISMISKNEYPKLLERISSDQLLTKYGGTLQEKGVYWPPENTLGKPPHSFKELEKSKTGEIDIIISKSEVQTPITIEKETNQRVSIEDISRENYRLTENMNVVVKSYYAQNSGETGTKDTEMLRNANKGEDPNFQERQDQQTFNNQGIERNAYAPTDINYSSRVNDEMPVKSAIERENSQEIQANREIDNERMKTAAGREPTTTQQQNTYDFEDDHEGFGGRVSYRADDSKLKGVLNAKLEYKDSDSKTLNERNFDFSSNENNDFKGKKYSKKPFGVTFGGVEVNELSRNYSGKCSKSGAEDDGGLLLEKDAPPTGICGFCRGKNLKDEPQSCNIF